MVLHPFKVIGAFLRAVPIMLSKGHRLFILVPLLANVVLMGLLYAVAFSYFNGALEWLVGYVPGWMSIFNWLFYLVFGLIITILVFYSFSVGVNILAAPFMAFLAEKVEETQTGKQFREEFNVSAILNTIGHSLQREGQKILYFLPRFILLLVLSFIPILNLITPILMLFFSAWMLALQYMDYAFDNNKITFYEMRVALSAKPLVCWTFGSIVMIGLMVPFFNLFVMPLAVIAATLLWISVFRVEFEDFSSLLDLSNGKI